MGSETIAGAEKSWPAILGDAWQRDGERIRRRLARMVGDADAEDLAQDVFERAHRSQPPSRVENVSAWLVGIATHAAIDWQRAGAVRAREASRSVDEAASGCDETAPDSALERLRMRGCISGLVARLPPGQRAVMALAEIAGQSDRDTAEALGLSVGAAKIRLHRARRALRALMDRECRTFRDDRNELGCEPVRPSALRVLR